ncbi:MAG: FmdB family zinc ribbon protein [Ignavibacteria bacterium]
MPIFEYRCENCNTKFEILHKSSEHQDEIICPSCGSKNYKKLFSVFSASMGDSGSDSSCSDGSCSAPSYGGGCASGLCGLN